MRYQISGKQIDIGDALQTHVKSELDEVVSKYAQRATEALVVFSRMAHEFVCESTVHLSTGLTVSASGRATEVYAAFEGCREKMDKQLRRYKRRLRDHHDRREEPVEFGGGVGDILASTGGAAAAGPGASVPIGLRWSVTSLPPPGPVAASTPPPRATPPVRTRCGRWATWSAAGRFG